MTEARPEPFEDAHYVQDGVFRAWEALQDQIEVFDKIFTELDNQQQNSMKEKE